MVLRTALILTVSAALASADTLTVVASAETHGMIYSCDCPHDPGGGMAKRATVVRALGDSSKVLLLDAGGFSAGGPYDTYTEGRPADSARTVVTIRAMGALRYAAAAVGDDDLQFGASWLASTAAAAGLPLVSANVMRRSHGLVFAPFVIVRKGGRRIGITGLCTPERLLGIDPAITIADPVGSLKNVWPELTKKSDVQIILAHVGEEVSQKLAREFPGAALIVNGHRKQGNEPVLGAKGVPVLSFGFQGKALSMVALDAASGRMVPKSGRWLRITNEVPDDSAMVRLVASDAPLPVAMPVYDLYLMSLCPYGIPALRELGRFIERFPDLEWNLWFVGSVDGDTALSSLHGITEVADEKVWLAVKTLYPGQWVRFINLMIASPGDHDGAINALKLDAAAIGRWVKANGTRELALHYRRSMRLGINASPTLLVNNVPDPKEISVWRLARSRCAAVKAPFCDSLPVCLDDADCRKSGRTGRCETRDSMPSCVFYESKRFLFRIVVADTQPDRDVDASIATTTDLFPGAVIKKILLSSSEAGKWIGLFKPAALPFYVIDTTIVGDINAEKVMSGLDRNQGYLTFKSGIIRPTYFFRRKESPRQKVLYVDPIFPQLAGVVDSSIDPSTRILPLIYRDPKAAGTADPLDRLRLEEATRWLVLEARHPQQYRSYLARYAKEPGTSFWFVIAQELKIDLAAFTTESLGADSLLANYWKEISEFGIKEPAALLVGNRRLFVAREEQDLREISRRLRTEAPQPDSPSPASKKK